MLCQYCHLIGYHVPRVRYEYVGHVGDQDWLTVLGWDKPQLFHLLGCEYNLQVS